MWKKIKGYEGLYEINEAGQVKSIRRIQIRSNGSPIIISEKIKKPYLNKSGYVTIALIKNNTTANRYLHRLIAEAFVPNPKRLNVVNHKNGIKSDNRIANLEWCTSSHNNLHAIHTRLRKPAKACITEADALKISEMRIQGLTYEEIGAILNIPKYSIGSFLRGESYRWLYLK